VSYQQAEERIRAALRIGAQELHLAGLHLEQLPPEVGQLTQLRELYLLRNQLTGLPTEISQLTQLQLLDLDGNQLASFPPEISQLSQLQRLNLRANRLASLPAELGQLSELRGLDLAGNRLTSFPAELGQLCMLRVLALRGNQLTGLPAELGQLSELRELHLSNNQLSSLPREVGQLTRLERLDLENNQLSSLPAELGRLTRLARLDLGQNQLSSLPAELGQATELQQLGLDGNPIALADPDAAPRLLEQMERRREDRATAYRCLLTLGLGERPKHDPAPLEPDELCTLLQERLERGDSGITVAMFTMADLPDVTIAWLLSQGALRQPVPDQHAPTQLTLTSELMQRVESADARVDLLDLAAASAAAVELFLAIAAACLPWGVQLWRPAVSVRPGSVRFKVDQPLLAQVTAFLAKVAATLDTSGPGAPAGSLLVADKFLHWWHDYELESVRLQRERAAPERVQQEQEPDQQSSQAELESPRAPATQDQPAPSDEPQPPSGPPPAAEVWPAVALTEDSRSVAARVPEHVLQEAAKAAGLPADFATHILNRVLLTVHGLLANKICIRAASSEPDARSR
jgi:hypothetical protein